MKFHLVFLFAFATCCAAIQSLDLSADIPADSRFGNKLLSKARRVNKERGLQDEEDFTWLLRKGGYAIKFNSCHTIHLFGGEGEEQQKEEGEDGNSLVGLQHLVHFNLCAGKYECDKCKNGGQYVVQMRQFLEAYLEMREEYCEAIADACNCDYYNGDDERCEAKCYKDEGADFCIRNEQGQGEGEEFELEQYIECVEAEFSNDEYYDSTFFIGPVCASDSSGINLGLFKDAKCSKRTDNSAYSKYTYGSTLPYSESSIVDNQCYTCRTVDGYYNGAMQYAPNELCTLLYQESAKCEEEMQKENSDVGSCTYINDVLPALEEVYVKAGDTGIPMSTIFAILFLCTTIAATGGLFYFYKAASRQNVELTGDAMSGPVV